MRINIYNEEFTDRVEIVRAEAKNTGMEFIGVRFYLKSPPELHTGPEDDDTSAVTFWVGADQAALLIQLMELATAKIRRVEMDELIAERWMS